MNLGLFATLAGFLLPLTIFVRVATSMARAQQPLGQPVQAARIVILLLVSIPITGKLAAVVFALTGEHGDVGQLTIDFMPTPWGLAHLILTIAAVIAFDIFSPRIVAQLEASPRSDQAPIRAHLLRDLGIIALLFGTAWLGAR